MNHKPAIVVVAYNRPKSLERVLFSLKKAERIQDVRLIISIDNKEPENLPVRKYAESFEWPFGEKEVIYQKKRLGLRNHILKCGDLSMKYGSVIILEDDLFISPLFYHYAVNALDFYNEDENIGGISLYSQPREDITELPFTPVNDGTDVFFLQFPSSWGQAWTKSQWSLFREWYAHNQDISRIPISEIIHKWPETSWKKYFTAYLADTHKFFVYPRVSLTTNFNDPGTNYKRLINYDGQAPLRLSQTGYKFAGLTESFSVYDSYFELMQESLKKLTPELNEYVFEMDLYGNKKIKDVTSPYIITRKGSKQPVRSYARSLKPHDMNIICNLPGDDFFLSNKNAVVPSNPNTLKQVFDFKYYFTRHIPGKNVYLYKYFSKFKLYNYLLSRGKS